MRFHLARWLDRLLPHACWAYLYSWSVRDDGYTFSEAVRRYPLCVDDVARGNGCWCGKNRCTTGAEFGSEGGSDGR